MIARIDEETVQSRVYQLVYASMIGMKGGEMPQQGNLIGLGHNELHRMMDRVTRRNLIEEGYVIVN